MGFYAIGFLATHDKSDFGLDHLVVHGDYTRCPIEVHDAKGMLIK